MNREYFSCIEIIINLWLEFDHQRCVSRFYHPLSVCLRHSFRRVSPSSPELRMEDSACFLSCSLSVGHFLSLSSLCHWTMMSMDFCCNRSDPFQPIEYNAFFFLSLPIPCFSSYISSFSNKRVTSEMVYLEGFLYVVCPNEKKSSWLWFVTLL